MQKINAYTTYITHILICHVANTFDLVVGPCDHTESHLSCFSQEKTGAMYVQHL